ncbi:MAG: InlB B-repeat-containing protein [Emergencia sp.]|nr:InlB B-repeat-containing protein [Emergencia sp.]
MKKFKKAVSIFLCLLIVLAMMPMAAFADGEAAGDGSNEPVKVTLTYDANAGEDEVTGLPAVQSIEVGGFVTIANYRHMTREGYNIRGWSTNPDATFPDTSLAIGAKYTLNKDTKFYAIWSKLPDETEPEEPGLPEGAKLQQVVIQPTFWDTANQLSLSNCDISYDYSYSYEGQTYTGTTKMQIQEMNGYSFETGNLVLDVLVDENGTMDTTVMLKAKQYGIDKYRWDKQKASCLSTGFSVESDSDSITIPVNSRIDYMPSIAGFPDVKIANYYTKLAEDTTVTKRDVDIMVSFVDMAHDPFILNKVSADYTVTYSYEDAEGKKVTNTLKREDAEVVDIHRKDMGSIENGFGHLEDDPNVVYHFLKWTVEVPVIGKGIDLEISQDNYQINEDPYVWCDVIGPTSKGEGGSYVGKLYVSKDNNPVTPYIYNIYGKQYNVTYTDGVEGSELFTDQTYQAVEGSKTPAFVGTPKRFGYRFDGWSPAVAETVAEDVTYTAQWTYVGFPVTYYTVTYTDGVDGEVVFADQTTTAAMGESTPAFSGTPSREGYTFTGWSPAVADTVTGDAVYVAQWSENANIDDPDVPLGPGPDEPVIDDPDVPLGPGPDEPVIDDPDVPLAPAPAEDADSNQPKTGDEAPLALLMGMFLVSAGALGATVIRRKEKAEK